MSTGTFDRTAFASDAFDLEIWDDTSQQVEIWSSQDLVRVFDANVFENNPIFDTGTSSGVWTERTKQPEVWT